MANKISTAELPATNFVDATSRYKNSQVIHYGDRHALTFETYKRQPIPTSPEDRFYVITKGTEYRPDMVAQRAYGMPGLWWRIMQANNLKDIWEFKAGLNIRIPNSL